MPAGDAILCCDTFDGHNEGNVFINAFCQVNLTESEVTTGEYITVNSGLGGALCQTPTNTLLVDATLDNDFGKLGEIAVTARGRLLLRNVAMCFDRYLDKPVDPALFDVLARVQAIVGQPPVP